MTENCGIEIALLTAAFWVLPGRKDQLKLADIKMLRIHKTNCQGEVFYAKTATGI